jgi:hypothetical protein
MTIYCVECGQNTNAKLTNGKEIYPHRQDLYALPFWKCPRCSNYVGCHKKSKNRPLGVIPNKEIKKARMLIHELVDPLWKSGCVSRGKLYGKISDELGYRYHTANIKSIDEARKIYTIILKIKNNYV